MNIGQAIKDIRKSKNLSQFSLAEKIQLSQTSLSQIELGYKKPNANTLKKICEVFGMSEPLIYIAAVDEMDVPKEKREVFKILYPSVKAMILQIAG